MILKQEQKLSQTVDIELLLTEAGVLHIDSVREAIAKDVPRKEAVALRYNSTTCKSRLNSWLNARGIFQTRPETWPKPPARLNLFVPEKDDEHG